LIFKKRYFGNPKQLVTDPVAFDLLFHQAIHDVVTGILPMDREDATILAGLHINVVQGEDSKPITEGFLHWHVPSQFLKKDDKKDWVYAVNKQRDTCKALSSAECKQQYMEIVTKHPFYGASLFAVEQQRKPFKIWMYLTADGISVTEEASDSILEQWKYNQIPSFTAAENIFSITVGSLLMQQQRRIFFTNQAQEISQVMRAFSRQEKKTRDRARTVIAPPATLRQASFRYRKLPQHLWQNKEQSNSSLKIEQL